MKMIAIAVVLAAMGVAVPSWAATDAECQEVWKMTLTATACSPIGNPPAT